jgi:hypothetical protein
MFSIPAREPRPDFLRFAAEAHKNGVEIPVVVPQANLSPLGNRCAVGGDPLVVVWLDRMLTLFFSITIVGKQRHSR